jgi:hypothetical protein
MLGKSKLIAPQVAHLDVGARLTQRQILGNTEPPQRGLIWTERCVELNLARRKVGSGSPATEVAPRRGTFVSLVIRRSNANVADVDNPVRRSVGASMSRLARSHRLFYGLFLPAGVVANLVLGLLILTGLRPESWSGWLQVGCGAFCCLVAGWLAAASFSNSYWSRSMARQVAVWRQIADAFFGWLEDAPLPVEDLRRLKTSLDEVVRDPKRA